MKYYIIDDYRIQNNTIVLHFTLWRYFFTICPPQSNTIIKISILLYLFRYNIIYYNCHYIIMICTWEYHNDVCVYGNKMTISLGMGMNINLYKLV